MSLEKYVVLSLLNEDNRSPILGKTRFQKLVFLTEMELRDKNKVNLSFNFSPFRFGPYSSRLNFLINEMIDQGMIKETKGSFGDKETVSFHITTKGLEELSKLPQNEDIIKVLRSFKENYKKIPLDKLLMKVYKKYPQFATRSELVEFKFE